MAERSDDLEECPSCGEPIPRHAAACPHCASEVEPVWSFDADQEPAGGRAGARAPSSEAWGARPGGPQSHVLVWGLILAAFTALLAVARHVYPHAFLPFFGVLALACLSFFLGSRKR